MTEHHPAYERRDQLAWDAVQRAVDGYDWEPVARIAGAGEWHAYVGALRDHASVATRSAHSIELRPSPEQVEAGEVEWPTWLYVRKIWGRRTLKKKRMFPLQRQDR